MNIINSYAYSVNNEYGDFLLFIFFDVNGIAWLLSLILIILV